jgi:hypothetical protein
MIHIFKASVSEHSKLKCDKLLSTFALNYNLCHYNLEVLQWAREHGCLWARNTCVYAAGGGYLKVLKWAREQGCPWDERACSFAAMGGHLEVLQWALQHGCPCDCINMCAYAAAQGHLDVLQWARAHDCPWDKTVVEQLCKGTCTCCGGQGLTLVPFSAQLEPCLTHKNTLHTLNTP